MRQPSLYHRVQKLSHQLQYLKDHVQLRGNRPLGGSEEAHLWTPEEEREANLMAMRAKARGTRPPQYPDDTYLHIQGNRPAEQYAEGYAPTGDEYHWMARALPASELADHRRELTDLAQGFRGRGQPVPDTIGAHLRTAEHQLGRRIGTGYAADINKRIGNKIKKISHEGLRGKKVSHKQAVGAAEAMVRSGKYARYAESPKDANDFADRARRPQPRRRAARILERAAEENAHHGYGNHPAVMRMRQDAQRQEREAEREERPPPRYSRYADQQEPGLHGTFKYKPGMTPSWAWHQAEGRRAPNKTQANKHGYAAKRFFKAAMEGDEGKWGNSQLGYSDSTTNPFRSISYAGPDPRDRKGKKLASRAITASRRANASDAQRDHENAILTNRNAGRHFAGTGFGSRFGEAMNNHTSREHEVSRRMRNYGPQCHTISYGRQATCGGCGQVWYIATDSIDLVCPRCGFNSTKYAVTDQPGIYGPATAAPAPGGRRGYGPNRPPTPPHASASPRRPPQLGTRHDQEAEHALPMDKAPPRRPRSALSLSGCRTG